ncbi:type II secretion system minor pseudopilin GspK [Endozoicomonas numazuensis]|uniref:Type II secretion system protein K n=1 Tax=Endozoicomonas numazuensis TaxID=1137799 RepID=A0A081NHZ4_9GAMM|nr:type II secretion system minor pseudopilin GspK [Endozoicomonas numazuensis]KEQ18067.1 hypothetical protein GZ78_10850 [Endozoicomonas numazuensis]
MLARQQGIALVYVLLLFSVITVMASQMIIGLMNQTRHSSHYLERSQARLYALGVEQYLATVLEANAQDDLKKQRRVDALAEAWNLTAVAFELEQGSVEISVQDEQGLLNMNNLAAQNTLAVQSLRIFQNLLVNHSMDPNLAYRVQDWVDSDREVSSQGAEDNTYLLASPAYRTANTTMTSLSELRLIQGWFNQSSHSVMPELSALPDTTRININTAPRDVLLALSNQLSTAQVDDIIQQRQTQGIDSMEALLNIPSLKPQANDLQAAPLTFYSQHFSARIKARFRDTEYEMRSWFQVSDRGEVFITHREVGSPMNPVWSQGVSAL